MTPTPTASAASARRATQHSAWLVLGAAAVLAITMGARASMGLFVSPLNTATGMGLATVSLAMAVGQFVWGAAQPVAGAVADRFGTRPVVISGIVLAALGVALTPLATGGWSLALTLGLVSAAGAGAASFSVLIGAVAQQLPPERRGPAAGIINAGSSFGQFVFAPVTQALITALGWIGALYSLAVITLLALPLTRVLPWRAKAPPAVPTTAAPTAAATAAPIAASAAAPPPAAVPPAAPETTDRGLRHAVRQAMRDRSYLLLVAGFFTCGFHIAFLVTHLPGEVAFCGLSPQVASWSLAIIGLSNIGGSLFAGWWVNRLSSKYILFWMYASRAVLVLAYLAAPKTPLTFYVFAVGLGVTWLATVPPTASVIGKLFGPRYLATLFGFSLLSHQVGGFLGAWLGGIAFERNGSYLWMWYADAVLAVAAAVVNLPIRETAPTRAPRSTRLDRTGFRRAGAKER